MNTLINKLRGDRVIWMTALFLGLISLLAVYSSISSLAFKREGGSTLHFLFKHGLMLLSGGVIMYYASMVKYTIYSRLSQLVIPITGALLLLTLLLGSNINDASRWITIPIINQSFQTSDLAKVVLIVYLARVLGKHHDQEWTFRDVVLQLMLPVGVICGLILPANFSTAALLFLLCMIIMFIGQVIAPSAGDPHGLSVQGTQRAEGGIQEGRTAVVDVKHLVHRGHHLHLVGSTGAGQRCGLASLQQLSAHHA